MAHPGADVNKSGVEEHCDVLSEWSAEVFGSVDCGGGVELYGGGDNDGVGVSAGSFDFSNGELEKFLSGKPTELDAGGDYTVCRCKLHKRVVCGVPGGEGCEGRKPGSLPTLAALYDGGGRRYCHATESTRLNDQAFVAMALDLSVHEAAFAGRVSSRVITLASGSVTSAESWGAGFCYQPRIVRAARWRVGRVLGPECLAVDLLRVLRLVGESYGAEVMVHSLPRGLHVTRDKSKQGQSALTGIRFVRDLVRLIGERGDHVRIGMGGVDDDYESGGVFRWLKGCDVVMPSEAAYDLKIVSLTAGLMPTVDAKIHHKKLALVGDRVLKLLLAVSSLTADCSIEAVQAVETRGQSDAMFASIGDKRGFLRHVVVLSGVDVTSARVGGSAFEAMVGMVYVHCGLDVVKQLMDRLEVAVNA